MTVSDLAIKISIHVPRVEDDDVVALELGNMVGIYTETEWRIPISAGGTMEHKARRIIL